ncbi:glycoside hydrolase family 43 protein [Aureibacillus halotolerans]|uniref:Xylan 1,4-beta-xylosidase n=1 Tax=Aureibacillus halotolerans TaxID=1508390 RepID=A0A4V3D4T7_9BACI|nr:glycoside hydrolase family 43 protein [Aureibacillus halotolerans]TDQ37467.1 xylan 1,4-beta-xylosidase [Aureibacillus halotolerans]
MTTIKNPILTGFHPDPSVCRHGEDYYVAVSTFEWFPGVQIFHSKDLKNWRLVSRPLSRVSQLDMKGNPNSGGVWAPCLSYHDGKFWLIYSDVKVVSGAWKDGHNYLVTCDTIDGEWSDPIYLNSSGFDPSLFHDPSGKKYVVNMVWDQRQHQHSFYGIVLQEYDHTEQRLIGPKEIIFKGTNLKLTEAPHLYKMGDYYYLLTAEGGTKYEHAATIARSTSLHGPYEVHPSNPLITSWPYPENPLQKAGHASIVHTHTDEWYMLYLMARPLPDDTKSLTGRDLYCPLGRETSIAKLEWRDNWPYIHGGGNQPTLTVEGPAIPEHPWPEREPKDDFLSTELSHEFQSLRIPLDDSIMSLKDRAGYLRLYGKESLTSLFTQAHVARRWQDFYFRAETKLDVHPTTFQQAAGLVCYYNTDNWTSLQVTWHETKGKVLDIVRCDQAAVSQPIAGHEVVIEDDKAEVYLRVDVRGPHYQFSYSLNGDDWVNIGPAFESYKISDDYIRSGGFFTGGFVGMHCQDTSGENVPADFDYFFYGKLHDE